MAPWTTPHIVMNFAETRRDPAAFWGGEAHQRLCRLKQEIDPGDLFPGANHPVLREGGAN